jgi:WD40 repeat protein
VIRRDSGLLAADVGSGRQVCELAGATIVAASADGRTLAVAVQRDDPYYEPPSWKPGKGSPRRPPDAPAPEGATIVLLGGETGKEKRQVPATDATVWGLAFSPDGKALAANCGLGPGQIRLYQVSTGGLVRSLTTPAIAGACLAFSPDGSRLATAMADTSILLWDLRPGP